MMYDDYISFFIACLDLESGIVVYLYWCRIFSGDHKFGLIDYNVVHQIVADRVDQLHLVAHYIEDHFLRGRCFVYVQVMYLTWIMPARLDIVICFVLVLVYLSNNQVYVTTLQVVFDGPHEVA